MNAFEELCKLASAERWCWKLHCSTCGHMHFRYAFAELAAGKSPADAAWVVHSRDTRLARSLGPLQRSYSQAQEESLCGVCRQADLETVAKACRFPDWLGYLGLVLHHVNPESQAYRKLSENWAAQLAKIVPEHSIAGLMLSEMAKGGDLLDLKDLEVCESAILRARLAPH